MKIEIMIFIFVFGFCTGAVVAMAKEQYRRKKRMQRRNEFINRRTNSTTEAFAGIAQALNRMNDTVATTTKGITKFKGSSNSMTNDEYRNALKRDLDERKSRSQLIIEYANEYSGIALKKGSRAAMQKFHKDYFTEKIFNAVEHEVILHLTKAYLLCKAGQINRAECNQEQKRLLLVLEN